MTIYYIYLCNHGFNRKVYKSEFRTACLNTTLLILLDTHLAQTSQMWLKKIMFLFLVCIMDDIPIQRTNVAEQKTEQNISTALVLLETDCV
jgi:hypothetical protein